MSAKRFTLAITLTLLLSSSAAFAADCTARPVKIVDRMVQLANPKTEQVREFAANRLLPILLAFGLIRFGFAFITGHRPDRTLLLRALVVLFFLANYSGGGNFRDEARLMADSVADTIGGRDRLATLFDGIYSIFTALQPANQSNFLKTAGAVFTLLLTPAGAVTLLFIISTLFVAILSFVIDMGTAMLLIFLDIIGPVAIAFGVLEGTERIAWGWATRYLEVCCWKIGYQALILALSITYTSLAASFTLRPIENAKDTIIRWGCMYTAELLAAVVAITAVSLLCSLPFIISAVFEGRSFSSHADLMVS